MIDGSGIDVDREDITIKVRKYIDILGRNEVKCHIISRSGTRFDCNNLVCHGIPLRVYNKALNGAYLDIPEISYLLEKTQQEVINMSADSIAIGVRNRLLDIIDRIKRDYNRFNEESKVMLNTDKRNSDESSSVKLKDENVT